MEPSRQKFAIERPWIERRFALYLGRALIVILIALAWEGLVMAGWLHPAKAGRPSDVLVLFYRSTLSGELWMHLKVTLYEAFIGFAIGVGGGTALGLGLWWSRRLSRIFEPFAVVFNGIPKIALAPPMIVWFGIFETSKIVLAATITFVIAWLSAYDGTRLADRDQMDMVRVMGGSRWQIFTRVVIPTSLPWIIASLKINIGFALSGAIVGEFVASNHGLGYLAVQAANQFEMSRLWMVVFVIMFVAALQYWVVLVFERRALGWVGDQRFAT